MFGHRSFLILGGDAADILSLVKGGLEILDCKFSFQQAVDQRGKATTRVHAGIITVILSQLPTQSTLEWGLDSRKYKDGFIVMLDHNNIPVEKIFFNNAACVGFELDYTHSDNSYVTTKLTIQAEQIIVGNGISFDNEWTDHN